MSKLAITLHTAAQELTDGIGAAVDLESDSVPLRRVVEAVLDVSAVTGTLGLSFQTSRDGASWLSASDGTYTTIGGYTVWVGECLRYLRASWSLGGGTATFGLTGTAGQTFCTLDQLTALGGAADILIPAVSTATRLKHLLAVSQVAKGYLANAGPLPILSVGDSVARAVAQLTVVDIITADSGLHPSEGVMELLLRAADKALTWLRDVSARKVDVSDDVEFSEADTTTVETGGVVIGDLQRNWSALAP